MARPAAGTSSGSPATLDVRRARRLGGQSAWTLVVDTLRGSEQTSFSVDIDVAEAPTG